MEKSIHNIMHSKHFTAILLLIVTLTSTFSAYLPEKLDMIAIYLPQLILCLYALILINLYWKKTYRPKSAANILFYTIIIFAAYYILITGYRFITGGNVAQSLDAAIVIFTSAILFFLVDANIIDRKTALVDIIITTTIINIIQATMGFLVGSIRLSPVLQNIMVYNCIMLFMVPCFFYFAQNRYKFGYSSLWSFLCWINLLFILVFIPASGSRSGMILLVFTFLVSMIINYKKKSKFVLKCLVLYTLAVAIIFTLYTQNMMDFQTAALRQKLAFLEARKEQTQATIGNGEVQITENTNATSNDQVTTTNEVSNNQATTTNTISNEEEKRNQNIIQNSIVGSDNIRDILWKKSIEELKKSPIIGTGTMLFEVQLIDGKLLQGSHNIILETSLAFGIIGMIIYFVMAGTPVTYVLTLPIRTRNNYMARETLNYLVSIVTVFTMAMVQPVLIMAFPAMLAWLMTGIIYKQCSSSS